MGEKMNIQKKIRQGMRVILATKSSQRCGTELCGQYDDCDLCLTDQLLNYQHSQGAVIKVEKELPLIERERAESAVPKTDCSGSQYTPVEWEDNVRYVITGAEIQRDNDRFNVGCAVLESLIQKDKETK